MAWLFYFLCTLTRIIFAEESDAVTLTLGYEFMDVRRNSTTLYITGRNITDIGSRLFSDLSYLQTLHLSMNNISAVAPDAFTGTKVEFLDLSHNHLKEVPDLTALRDTLSFLNLAYNPITDISWNLLVDLHVLESLDLSQTQLTVTPGDNNNTETFSSIKSLYLNGLSKYFSNESSMHNSAFSGFNNLQELYLNGGFPRLKYVSSYLGQILLYLSQNLKVLEISNNEFNFAPKEWDKYARFDQLQVIIMQHNGLESVLDYHITIKHTLNVLDLSHNLIDNLHNFILDEYKELKKLILRNNLLHVIPQLQVKQTTHSHLGLLDLSQNVIRNLGDFTFDSFVNLSILNLSANCIRHLPDNTSFPDSITTLDLGFNYIKTMNCSSLSGLKFVEKLILKDNYLSDFSHATNTCILDLDLSSNLFETFPNVSQMVLCLRTLNLNGNRIHTLQSSLLQSLHSLSNLDLSRNRIKHIPDLYTMRMTNLTALMVLKNPLHCGCRLRWLKENGLKLKLDIRPSVKPCGTPTDLEETKWQMISPERMSKNCYIADTMNVDMGVEKWTPKEAPGGVYLGTVAIIVIVTEAAYLIFMDLVGFWGKRKNKSKKTKIKRVHYKQVKELSELPASGSRI